MCPIKKKDGSIRLCVEYRTLNSKTKDTAIPTGNLIAVVESMTRAQFFSHIDLAHGYYQVPIAENDKEKTAFRASTVGPLQVQSNAIRIERHSSKIL